MNIILVFHTGTIAAHFFYFKEFLRSGRPLLLSAGFPENVVNTLETRAMQEVNEARIPLFFRLQNVFARRRTRVASTTSSVP